MVFTVSFTLALVKTHALQRSPEEWWARTHCLRMAQSIKQSWTADSMDCVALAWSFFTGQTVSASNRLYPHPSSPLKCRTNPSVFGPFVMHCRFCELSPIKCKSWWYFTWHGFRRGRRACYMQFERERTHTHINKAIHTHTHTKKHACAHTHTGKPTALAYQLTLSWPV